MYTRQKRTEENVSVVPMDAAVPKRIAALARTINKLKKFSKKVLTTKKICGNISLLKQRLAASPLSLRQKGINLNTNILSFCGCFCAAAFSLRQRLFGGVFK